MGNDHDVISLEEDEMDIRQLTSTHFDLNVDQYSQIPKASPIVAANSSHPVNEDTNTEGVIKIGMEFESDEEAYSFYYKYAGLIGFSVRKDWVNRSKVHGRVVSRKFTCSRQGYRRKDKRDANVKKHRKETRTGCLAHMIVTRQSDGKYRVTHFVPNHNHENIDPNNAQKLCELTSQENTDVVSAYLRNNLEKQPELAFQMLGRRLGAPDTSEDIRVYQDNYLRSGRTRDINEGEAARLLCYFQRQHFENPSFFYSIQLDIDDKVSNIFWADDNMVLDYDHFGDVICLDTTFRLDTSFRPFVQFIGLNHHRQVVIFGAALLYDETDDSLKWLFRSFIHAMSGKKPKVILTDQDATVVQAIASVMPEVNHRVCTLQMYRNALQQLRHVIKDADPFAKDFKRCIFDYEDEGDLIQAWDSMLNKFGIQQNEWLRWMFREKDKWSLAYGMNSFFVDKNNGHLCENLSDQLRHYLNPEIDLLQFFKHFESIVYEQRFKELEASYEMQRCGPRLMANVVVLKQSSEVYTPRAFEVFQQEYEKSLNVVVNKCSQNDSLTEYTAKTFGKCDEFSVTFNSLDDTVICSCMKFEYVGVLCCHAIKILDHHNIKVVPTRYILKRWTRDARVERVKENYVHDPEENTKLTSASRYKDLCRNIVKVAARAAESDQAYEFATRQLDEVIQGVEKILTMKPREEAHFVPSNSSDCEAEILLERNTIEGQDIENIMEETNEMESSVPGEDQANPFNFEANDVAECMLISSRSAVDPRTRSSPFQSQNFYSNHLDPPVEPQLVEVVNAPVLNEHLSSFIHHDQRYMATDVCYFGSK